MSPKISLIIPIFNTAEHLPTCIDSVLSQSFFDFELLLINDGSLDTSGKICDEFALKDNRIRVFHKENGGVSSARNLGLKESNGKWVCFIDSDDFVLPNYLERFESEEVDEETDLVIQGIIKQTEKGNFKRSFQNIVIKSNDFDGLFVDNRIHDYGYPVAKLFKIEVIRHHNITFPLELSLSEDLHFLLNYIHFSKNIQYTSEENYVYVRRQQSLSTTKKHPEEYFVRYLEYKKLLKEKYPDAYNSFFNSTRYHLLAQSLVSTLNIAIYSLYHAQFKMDIRLSYYKYLDGEDLDILKTYRFGKDSYLFAMLPLFVVKRSFFVADKILLGYYKIKHLKKYYNELGYIKTE